MSKIKRFLDDEIAKLSEKTGYDEDYLMDAYIFFMDFGLTFDVFKKLAENHEFDGLEFATF